MKKELLKISYRNVLILIISFALFSCDEYLEISPKNQISDASVWEATTNADLFLNNIYASVPSSQNYDPWDNYSDNSMHGQSGRPSLLVYGPSVYTPDNATSFWGHYSNIRKCNLFIQRVSSSDLPEDWKKLRMAEARFLRAYFYSLLWTYHGGVPIITDILNLNEQGDEIFRPRNTSEETFSFITSECDAIEVDLPLTTNESGRVTRGAALTLKAWCELFNAGALKNPENDKTKWEQAAITYKKVMDLNVYSLFPDYSTLFYEENNGNDEVIFARKHFGGTGLANYRDGELGPRFVHGTLTGWGHLNPTQDIVDEYHMANGLPISDPDSGYDPQNPYENREKRFYQSIVYDGSVWMDDIMIMKQGVGSLNATDIHNASVSTRTGYYLKKMINPKYAIAFNNQNSADYIIFRYAEVLLGYAEARNEATGPDESVYQAVNEVRSRSELPDLPVGLSQDEMRISIHRERRIELAFEDKRLRDLLRLRLAEVKLNGPLHAMTIVNINDEWVYQIIPAAGGMRAFYPEKNYLLPIPQSAIDRNPQLEQNPNYD